MREFFRGSKRKVGCVTLVLACLSTLGWVRSQSATDVVAFVAQGVTVNLYSHNGSLRLFATEDIVSPAFQHSGIRSLEFT